MLSIVVLISGTGSNLRALLEAIERSQRGDAADAAGAAPIRARIAAIGADTERANLALADEFGVPSFVVRPRDHADREAWGEALLERVREHGPDLVLLSGFMRLVPPAFVGAFAPNLLNTHPAHLPEFPGAHAVRDALAAGVTETGASIIIVDDGVDTGPVVDQVRVPIEPGDTHATLHERIKAAERRLLVDTVRGVADGTIDLDAIAAKEPTTA